MSRISLGTNVYALNAQRKLAEGTAALERTFERLSSGQRINRASDDAAGLSVASSLNTNKRVYSQGIRNANDGISLLNIADGALAQLSDLTTRQIELASQAANGTFSFGQRQTMHLEANALADEFNRLVSSTTFNGISLLDASQVNELRLQFGFGIDGGASFSRNRELRRTVGDGTFADSDTSFDAAALGTADFNGDGILDAYSTAGVSFGTGGGNFAAVSPPWGGTAQSVATGDFNGDGVPDLAITTSSSVETYLSNGNGTFTQGANVSILGTVTNRALAVGDFNGDGNLDLAFNGTLGLGTGIKTYLGNGLGGLGSVNHTGISATDFKIADFDRDGRSDLVTVSGSLRVHTSTGSGTFASPATVLGSATGTFVGDFDNDGYVDILAKGASTQLLKNLGGTSFSATTLTNVAGAVAVADLNGDGYLDILSEAYDTNVSGILSSYFSNGNGTFQDALQSTIANSGSGLSIVAADFNNDGVIDIIGSDISLGNELYFSNTTFTSNIAQVDLTTAESARSTLSTLRAQLQRISSERGALGSFQSRLAVSVDVLGSIVLNSETARGRIVDADIAQESAALTRQQIVQQTAAAVLAQANQAPALALRLLQNA